MANGARMWQLANNDAIVTVGDLLAQRADALAVAKAMVADGTLSGVATPALVVGRLVTGAATFNLVFDALGNEPAWHFPLALEEDADDSRERLLATHEGYLATRTGTSRPCPGVEHVVATMLSASGTGATLQTWGIHATPNWRVNRPAVSLLIHARGADAKPQLIHLTLAHSHGLDGDVGRIAGRHAAALPLAEAWATQEMAGAVDEAAHAVMVANGVRLQNVVAELGWRDRIPFRGRAGAYEGSFQWEGFAITVTILTRTDRKWTFRKQVLTIPDFAIPETLLGAAHGRRLSEFFDMPLLPGKAIIENVAVKGATDLSVTLRQRHLPFDAAGNVGQP